MKLFDTVKTKTSLEDLMERGVFDDRDIDYLDHLKVPELTEEEVIATEGITRAIIHDGVSVYTDAYRELKGYFLSIESKRKYIEEICSDLIEWLQDKDIDYRGLNLDMGSFKTWMKTSETYHWRFYFLLHDQYWSKIESDLKNNRITGIETLYDMDITRRKEVTDHLDSITSIKELIKIVELYIERSNKFFKLIVDRKVKIKNFPFQVILLGAVDLRRTVKKIVNLAI